MFKLPGESNLQEWNKQVIQLGLGDTTTIGQEERRLYKQGTEYNLYVNNGTENVQINNPFNGIKRPRVYTYSRKYIGASGTLIVFPEAYTSTPIPVGTPEAGPRSVRISEISTTQMKVYLYDTSGALVTGNVHIIVVGEFYV
jgi:hypothetical protein